VRRNLLKECDAHTLLRLPTGIFYAQGVKVNVLFFDRKPGASEPWTRTVWVYDLRTNRHFTLKTKTMTRAGAVVILRLSAAARRRRAPTSKRRSSGSGTRAWRIPPACPTRTSSPRKSPTTSGRRWRRSRTYSATWSSGWGRARSRRRRNAAARMAELAIGSRGTFAHYQSSRLGRGLSSREVARCLDSRQEEIAHVEAVEASGG